ncbi:MAG TPA: hypothetical protein VFH25_02410 [Nitrososphaeraceae archaeon]|nr:hypothetical protein [Nitrososphaeraceae archaeon]
MQLTVDLVMGGFWSYTFRLGIGLNTRDKKKVLSLIDCLIKPCCGPYREGP